MNNNNISTYLDISNLGNNKPYSYAFDNGALVAALNNYNTSQFGISTSGGNPDIDRSLELNYNNSDKILLKGGNILRKIIKNNYKKFNKLYKTKGGTADINDMMKYKDLSFNKFNLPQSINKSQDNMW